MRDQVFANGEYYHVYNRGVDKRLTFLNDRDYQRFIRGMRLFNSLEPIGHINRVNSVEAQPRQEPALVGISCYCLMPNHFHLLIQQLAEGGISKFLHRLQTGYTMYFNKRYERTGALFQSAYKCKRIKNDSYLLQLSRYIHLNPIKILSPDCIDPTAVSRLLQEYEWSSYREYCQSVDVPIADKKDLILALTGGADGYKKFVTDYVDKEHSLSRLSLDKRFL